MWQFRIINTLDNEKKSLLNTRQVMMREAEADYYSHVEYSMCTIMIWVLQCTDFNDKALSFILHSIPKKTILLRVHSMTASLGLKKRFKRKETMWGS